MRFRTLPIVAILFVAAAMIVQFVISFSLEKEHVRETVEYKMQLAQKDFFYVLLGTRCGNMSWSIPILNASY